MARFVLNKNPKSNSNIEKINKLLEDNTMNSIIYSDPFLKAAFLNKLLTRPNLPIIYLDFDLLYSGYVTANIVKFPDSINLFQPTKNEWDSFIQKILLKITETKTVIVIDSLNGFFNLFENSKDVGRLVNSYLMLLIRIAKMSKSVIILTTMARKTEKEWVLALTGRQIITTKNMTKIFLENDGTDIQFNVRCSNSLKNTFTISF